MMLPNIPNSGILKSISSGPEGYVTKDGKWSAVPFGNKFVIICNGTQVHVSNNLESAKDYISKKSQTNSKKKKGIINS